MRQQARAPGLSVPSLRPSSPQNSATSAASVDSTDPVPVPGNLKDEGPFDGLGPSKSEAEIQALANAVEFPATRDSLISSETYADNPAFPNVQRNIR